MLYKRQKLLLNLIHAAGGELLATDLQKLLLLYTKQCEEEPSFQFVPYRFGCFSFQSYADHSALERKGLLYPSTEEGESQHWKTTAKAKPIIDKASQPAFRHFLTSTVPERGSALVRRTYRSHPELAIRSEIVDEILAGKEEAKARQAVKRAAKIDSSPTLFTIGYEGDSIDGYLFRLLQNGVSLLCDVRKNPLSRKTGFSKKSLSRYCEKVGIEYLHLPELGIPGHRRRELKTMKDYEILFEEYCREDLPGAEDQIHRLGRLLKEHSRIALTCFEAEHECCHRHCVADEMAKLLADCPPVIHI